MDVRAETKLVADSLLTQDVAHSRLYSQSEGTRWGAPSAKLGLSAAVYGR